MDKINIVSLQAVLEMSSFSMDTRSMSSSPLVNSLVKIQLFKTAPDIDELSFQFIHTVDLSAFFKVVQQQTIGKVGNSIVLCGHIISVFSSERIIKIGQYLRKLCSNEKESSFFLTQCIMGQVRS